ncbi:MAG: RNA-binding cell elongation regulator Jag/EloR [Bacillota bacterium]
MAQSVEKCGKTVEEAVQEALAYLKLPRDSVDIEVLEEPTRGVLGLIGQRPARVRVTAKVGATDKAKEFLEELLGHMGFPNASVKASVIDGVLKFDIEGNDLGGLIGRRGATLDAIQYLVNLVASRHGRGKQGDESAEERLRILVDAEGYREKREQALRRLARGVAERVRREGKKASLEPMNPMERRIIHLTVQECAGVVSHSEGEEPYRYVVIAPENE